MGKKWAVILVLLGEALIYLFLLVGVPAYQTLLFGPGYEAVFKPPFLMYSLPGLIGLVLVVLILKQRREGKE